MIVRDWENEDTGKVADVLMVWSQGVTVGKKLDKLNAKGKLEARDIILEREGSKMNDTKYDISWAEEGDKAKRDAERRGQEAARKAVRPQALLRAARVRRLLQADVGARQGQWRPRSGVDQRRGAFARRDSKDADDKPARRPATRRASGTAKPAGLAGFGKKKDEDKKSSPETTVRRRRRS